MGAAEVLELVSKLGVPADEEEPIETVEGFGGAEEEGENCGEARECR